MRICWSLMPGNADALCGKAADPFIRDLLGDVQCQFMLVPPKYKPVEKIVLLLFDGEPSSVHTIKMFGF